MIRFYYPSDLEQVVFLAQEMHRESRYARYDFNPLKVEQLLRKGLEDPHWYMTVAEEAHRIMGFFCGVQAPFYFSSEWYAADVAWYIHPEHRGGWQGIRLLKGFEEWAYTSGCREVQIGLGTGINPEKTRALLNKLGYSIEQTVCTKCVA